VGSDVPAAGQQFLLHAGDGRVVGRQQEGRGGGDVLQPGPLRLDRGQGLVGLGAALLGGQPEVEDGFPDVAEVLGDDRFERADGSFEHADAVEQAALHLVVQSRGRPQVQDDDLLFLLTDPVDPADPLLDLHRVPRQVVVDDDRAELEVQALAGQRWWGAPGRRPCT